MTDLFGEEVTPPPAFQPAPPAGKSKLVFGQPAASTRPAAPPVAAARPIPKRDTLPPLLAPPAMVRPAHEHRLDEAQAGVLLFATLQRACERVLFDLRQAHPDYTPRIPASDELRIAAELLMGDPAVDLRLGLLAGSFRAPPAAESAQMAAPAASEAQDSAEPAERDPGEGDEAEEVVDAAQEGAEEPEEADEEPAPARPQRRRVAPLPTDGDLPERITRLLAALTAQDWNTAEPLVNHLPDTIRPHWRHILDRTRHVWTLIGLGGLTNLSAAGQAVSEIDSEVVRDAIRDHLATLARAEPVTPPPSPSASPPAPEKPQRRSRRAMSQGE
ncbi:hypothetical protein K2Z83_20420 [Oscillochloris sp. ZM17-4]|uniref:hypothetical protein n=1 Tax=Oscillochloris sp. ZM17-4 TaxID=2866714 RepID=UPI001C73BA25|nr:hypothetical protein [Oscillochloris sp. ZM17-4]MBX0330037.1 hypothetical protein [Oscillochloris sp. ZM17-4]